MRILQSAGRRESGVSKRVVLYLEEGRHYIAHLKDRKTVKKQFFEQEEGSLG